MPLTSYCKKCARDVPVGDRCPRCGAKLAPSAVRLAWCVDHAPLRDWMSWNAVMRVALPVLALALILATALELAVGGVAGVEAMLAGGLAPALVGMLALGVALLTLVFILQGDDVLDCVADSRGIHVQQYLPDPTPVKLLARLKSPRRMAELTEDNPMLLVGQRELAWKDVARVQLWPEKNLLLLYAPAWWLRLAVPCTPFVWADALTMVTDKLGRKKSVRMPRELAAPPKPKASKPARAKRPAEVSPAPFPAERAEDFTPLTDVLQEPKDAERTEDT